MASTGMILDGVAASEAIDTSGEVLDVAGCDVSSLPIDGILNFEHRGEGTEAHSSNDNVGKILTVKKIFRESDCENDRQRKYWKSVELPLIYFTARLFDGAGHPGAVALAAQIRDHAANKEPILVRWSIEGSTLDADGPGKKHLARSFARKIAATVRPANRSCASGVVEDPSAPEGFSKNPEGVGGKVKDELEEILKRSEDPLYRRLGSVEMEYDPVVEDPLAKALSAGSYDAAPSSLSGGAALQVEGGLKNRARAALRDWDGQGPFRLFLKHRLPEASGEFIDRFADMVDVARVPRRALLLKREGGALTVRGKPVRARAVKAPTFDEQRGVLHTPRGSFPVYVPSRDPDVGARESFHAIMSDPKLDEVHSRAMKNWARVNKRLRAGKLPPEVLMHASLFSMNSPNTPVHAQELMFSHLVDSMKSRGIDARDPRFGELKGDWLARDRPATLPEHSRKYFERIRPSISLAADSTTTERKEGEISSFMLPNSKWEKMEQYHRLHGALVDLVGRHRDDARSAISELMDHKRRSRSWEGLRERAVRNGRADPGPYAGPDVPGLAPKTGRYMWGMIGGSNVVVPDTHFIRHLFGLDKVKDPATIEHLKNTLWAPINGHVLDGIDRFYAANHDAVGHTVRHTEVGRAAPDAEHAVFPSFWRHWLAIAPHEGARGMGQANLAFNQATTHEPFWDAVNPHLRRSEQPEKPADATLPVRTAAEHLAWVGEHGENAAALLYFAHLVPQLLGDGREQSPAPGVVRKFEALSVELRKAAADLGRARGALAPEEPAEVEHAGKRVRVGAARAGGEKYSLLHAAPDHFVAVPEGRAGKHAASDVVRLAPGPGLKVDRWPEVLDEGLTVDADKHGSDLNKTKEQRALVHGLDFGAAPLSGAAPDNGPGGSRNREVARWMRGASGPVFVKAAEAGEDFPDAHREVAFGNLARDFFGLGEHVAPTALFRHPRTGREYVASGGVVGGRHWEGTPDQIAALGRLGSGGDIDKLAVMEMVLGHQDRHKFNYLFGRDGRARLIDHGKAFYSGRRRHIAPSYVDHYLDPTLDPDVDPAMYEGDPRSPRYDEEPLHSSAVDWVGKLDEGEFAKQLAENRVPEREAGDALYRLRNLKAHLRQHPRLSRARVDTSPTLDAGEGVRFAHPDALSEIAQDLGGGRGR